MRTMMTRRIKMVMLEAGEVLGGGGSIGQRIGMSLFLHRKYCCCCCQEQQMMNRSLGVAHDWIGTTICCFVLLLVVVLSQRNPTAIMRRGTRE